MISIAPFPATFAQDGRPNDKRPCEVVGIVDDSAGRVLDLKFVVLVTEADGTVWPHQVDSVRRAATPR